MYASENGNVSCVMKLLSAGADFYIQDSNKYTAISYASMNNHTQIVSILANITDNNGIIMKSIVSNYQYRKNRSDVLGGKRK